MTKNPVLKNDLFDFLGWTNSASNNFKVDIIEHSDSYVVEAEVPGINKSNINIDFHSDILTITVIREAKYSKHSEDSNVIISERAYGRASRQFAIRDVDEESISAKYDNGILVVTLPKYSKSKEGKKIEIE